ncbi:MAG: hypothetical protein TE42_10315 [Candidatus Synechococcus spongiarum SP3]|uniref:Uncharacterized protein n=1 Tax=Candidatus Synechococcus spongiarum SP3 TaxID=1604020 RepID=A0A0G2HIS7_9SYNE|nr:MAG: hypothetical protein TE42_10315 [Candidatus Synechococcus spongiarum SP3]
MASQASAWVEGLVAAGAMGLPLVIGRCIPGQVSAVEGCPAPRSLQLAGPALICRLQPSTH